MLHLLDAPSIIDYIRCILSALTDRAGSDSCTVRCVSLQGDHVQHRFRHPPVRVQLRPL
ncbi:hypothetical protein JOB18_031874 [Solea senegalensis]|uniref:Uncharacterized protein n=1 Tax=Solea senegalensis TaxID=28829 RepID=A0AAV6RCI9_SOLSE|nr:hypothetical protein JOB18_031874 [Solea senegalensis]